MDNTYQEEMLDYCSDDPMPGAEHKWLYFQNGYGASIIDWSRCIDAYPLYRASPLELAVFEWDWQDGERHILRLCYDTPITSDVERYCDVDDLNDAIRKISNL